MPRKNQVPGRPLAANRRKPVQALPPSAVLNPLSRSHLLHTEDEEAFQLLLSEYVAVYQPQHRDEYDLLTEAVFAKWRQQRLWLAETAQIEISMAETEDQLQRSLPHADAAAHLANGISDCWDVLRVYQRYDQQLHRHYQRCLQELRDLQAEREPDPEGPVAEVRKPRRAVTVPRVDLQVPSRQEPFICEPADVQRRIAARASRERAADLPAHDLL